MQNAEIVELARKIRYDIIMSTFRAGSGHPGGSLSIADALAALYGAFMRYNPKNPALASRDRLILSKGHAAPALYSALAECGYFDRKELWTLRKFHSRLQGHPDMSKGLPGIEMSTGSLGQGLSISIGLAIGARLLRENWRVYCISGDGELDEGQFWEAAMSATHYKLDNLCLLVDNNNLQIDGAIRDVMDLGDIGEKFIAFGWRVFRIDGHDVPSILGALGDAAATKEKPCAIILSTIKGRGVGFMENNPRWHGLAPNEDEAKRAIAELGFRCDELGGAE